MTKEQKQDVKQVTKVIPKSGSLDFVTGWYIKAAEYIRFTKIRVGLVSTNSVAQGEQAIVLWKYLMHQKDVEIHFAHQTFKWNNEAKGKAAVFCVIIGFSCMKGLSKTLFSYPDIKGKPNARSVKEINQYLLEASTIFIEPRSNPIHDEELMIIGSSPLDSGCYVFTSEERELFISNEPESEPYFRPYIGSKELINGNERFILYLKGISPRELTQMPSVMDLVNKVKEKRFSSKRKATHKLGYYPTELAEDRFIDSDILVVPKVSSENREYIPIGFYGRPTVCSDKTFQIPNASFFLFGMLNSNMHMAWMRVIGVRLKGDYSYSNTLVYNNFVFPEPTEKQRIDIEKKAQKIFNVRAKYTDSTLADLYNPIAMPPDLQKAHRDLDKSVEKAYGETFKTDEDRVAFLFQKNQEKAKGKIK